MASVRLPRLSLDRDHEAGGESADESHRRTTDLIKATGRSGFAELNAHDLSKHSELKAHFKQYALRDYFDDCGRRRFQSLSLTHAVKQSAAAASFGTKARAVTPAPPSCSPYAYALAAKTLKKDMDIHAALAQERMSKVTPADKDRVQEVRQHQIHMLFFEIPESQKFFPPGVNAQDLLPPQLSLEEERVQKEVDKKMNKDLARAVNIYGKDAESVETDWMLSASNVADLMRWAQAWVVASRGKNTPVGIDRPTFCRFLLDCGLVGTPSVPFHWAMSLFDELAKPVRLCPVDAPWAPSTPFAYMLNRWNMICVLDKIFRQLSDVRSKEDLMDSISVRVEQRLPSKLSSLNVLRSSGLESRGSLAAINRGSIFDCDDSLLPDLLGKRSSITSAGDLGPNGLTRASVSAADLLSLQAKRVQVNSAGSAISGHSTTNLFKPQSVDTSAEHLRRDRLVSSMLREPEVMHVMAQYRPLFEALYKCYANGDPAEGQSVEPAGVTMTFLDFLQFAVDFRVLPQVCTAYLMQWAYESAECLDRVEVLVHSARTPGEDRSSSSLSCPSGRRGSRGSVEPTCVHVGRRRIGADQKCRLCAGQENSPGGGNSGSPSWSKGGSSPRASPRMSPSGSPKAAAKLGMRSPRSPLLMSTRARGNAGPPKTRKPMTLNPPRSTPRARTRSGSSNVSRGSESAPRSRTTSHVTEIQVRFGTTAFIESLMKAVFFHLTFFGNSVQASSSSFAKAVWLVTYLRFVFDVLRSGRERQQQQTASGLQQPALSKSAAEAEQRLDLVFKAVDASLFIMPPSPPGGALNFPTFEPAPGPGLLHLSHTDDALPDGKRPRWEEPCVVDGVCRECCWALQPNNWGNPRCYGCAVVDCQGLTAQPIVAPLLAPNGLVTAEQKQPVFEVQLPAGFRPLPPVVESSSSAPLLS